MAWAAIASAAISAYSAYSSSKQGSAMQGISEDQLRMQREEWEWRMRAAEDALSREMQNAQYNFDLNDWRMQQAEDFMQYNQDWAARDFALRQDDAAYSQYRISEQDRLSAAERSRQLEVDLQNRNLAAFEREWAVQQFGYAKQLSAQERDYAERMFEQDRAEKLKEYEYQKKVAQGERAYDVQRFEEDRRQQQNEYELRMNEYRDMQRQLESERAYQMGRSEEVLMGARKMGGELERTLSGLGEMVPMKEYGESDVAGLESQIMRDYMKDADRAAQRMGSLNEASLMRAGVDAGTTGDIARGDVLEQHILPTLGSARARARQDAMSYINSLQGMEIQNQQQEMARRQQSIAEVVNALSPHLQSLSSAPMPGSAATTAWQGMGTGVLDRALRSAGIGGSGILERQLPSAANFQAPTPIGSALTPVGNYGIGMSSALSNPTSRYGSTPGGFYAGGANFWDPLAMSGPGTFLGGGSNFNPAAWQGASNEAWNKAGSNAQNFLTQAEALWKQYGNSGATGGAAGGTT